MKVLPVVTILLGIVTANPVLAVDEESKTDPRPTVNLVVHGLSYHVDRGLYDWNEFNSGAGFEVGRTDSSWYGILGMYINSYNKATSYLGIGYTFTHHKVLGVDVKLGVEAALVTGYELIHVDAIAGVVVRGGDHVKVLVIPAVSDYTTSVVAVSFVLPITH